MIRALLDETWWAGYSNHPEIQAWYEKYRGKVLFLTEEEHNFRIHGEAGEDKRDAERALRHGYGIDPYNEFTLIAKHCVRIVDESRLDVILNEVLVETKPEVSVSPAIDYLRRQHTRVLLNWLAKARKCHGRYCPTDPSYGRHYTIAEIKEVLATRPHIPKSRKASREAAMARRKAGIKRRKKN